MARTAGSAVKVEGLKDLSAELRKIDKKFGPFLRKVNKGAAEFVAERTRADAGSDRVAAKAAGQVRAAAGQRDARVQFSKTKSTEFVFGAFFGAKRFPQFRPWVGNQSTGGAFPYHLADVMVRDGDEFLDVYVEGLDDLVARAFPHGHL